jgi:hypothetical protein
MRKTLVVTHVMPLELEMFERFISYYVNTFKYLDPSNDSITLYATLNLNPELTDWKRSELKPQWFIDKFTKAMEGIPSYLQIVVDDSLWGTTQQKREVIKMDYDQFIFVDPDIAVHEQLLKIQLMAAERLSGPFVISPNIPRWWDTSWDPIVHPNFKGEELGQFRDETLWDKTFQQQVDSVDLKLIKLFKFGCGMHTLYSKEFWDVIGIPEEFGGYGSEDTFAMNASLIARNAGIDVRQYVLDGIFITEDRSDIRRIPSYTDKIVISDKKKDFQKNSSNLMKTLLNNYAESLGLERN